MLFRSPREILIIQPDIIPEFKGPLEEDSPDITVWQLFFAFFVILPISKMFSNIFMSIVARIGTVDEHSLGTGGAMGILGGVGALATATSRGARGSFIHRERELSAVQHSINSNRELAERINNSSGGGSPTVFAGGRGGGYTQPSGIGNRGGGNSSPDYFGESRGAYNYNSSLSSDPGIFPDGENPYASSPYDYMMSDPDSWNSGGRDYVEEPIDEYQHLLYNAGVAADRGGAGSFVGNALVTAVTASAYIAGATVGQGDAFARVGHGLAGRPISGLAHTFSVGKQVYGSVKGENMSATMNNLQRVTGRQTSKGAVAQMVVGAALAIGQGSERASHNSRKIGSIIDGSRQNN